MPRFPTRSELYHWIRGIARHEDRDIGTMVVRQPGIAKAIIPAAYVSGNPKIQQFWESSTTLGSKTHKVVQMFSNRAGAPAASDSIAIGHDPDGNKVILGKILDVGSGVIDSDYWMGFRPVEAGNTLLLTANTERNTTNTAYTTVKRFFVTRPGRYRIKCQLSRSGGSASAIVGIEMSDGTITTASSAVTESSVTYPTFSADKTADMTTSIGWGMFLVVQLKNSLGGANASYIQNVTVNYADATAALTPLDSVYTD